MDILRRNTDYALRAMANLAVNYNVRSVSTRHIADAGNIPYPISCKILQTLHKAKLVNSSMGPKGGFTLARAPSQITLLQIIEAIQGRVTLNSCLVDDDVCPRQISCAVNKKLLGLQQQIEQYLDKITLEGLLKDG